MQQYLWPAIGVGILFAANKMNLPAVVKGPAVVIGTLMLVKAVPVLNDKI